MNSSKIDSTPQEESSSSPPPTGRAVTLADVAAQAGVSTVAASVVLNNARSRVRVSAATRARILEAAERLQYRPNAVARSLRLQRTNIIGFYTAEGRALGPLYPFFAAILAGLHLGCEEHRKDFLMHGTFRDRSDDDVYHELLNGQIDGLVLYARRLTPLVERLIASRLPVVTIVNEVPGIPWIGIDDRQGGYLLANHLAEKGYKKVLYRRTETELPPTLQRRMDSFCEEAARHGITVLQSRSNSNVPDPDEVELLLSKDRPQVVAAWSDYSADGIVDFCRQQNLRIPEDLAITGFDNVPSTHRPSSRVTTIDAPWTEVARTAVSRLVARCNGEEVPSQTMLPVTLVAGETT